MAKQKAKRQFLLCINNEAYPASLEVRKVYQVVPDPTAEARKLVRIIDESGDDYLYPQDLFASIELSETATKAMQAG